MKKIRVFSFIIISFLINSSLVFGEDGLRMNPDDLKISNKSQVYNSITDIYGIPLFTDETTKKKAQIKEEEEKNLNNIEENIFNKSIEKSDSVKELYKKVNEYKLFSKPQTEVKIKYKKSDAGIKFISVMSIIAISILTGIFTTKYYKYKRKKEVFNIENNNYIGFK